MPNEDAERSGLDLRIQLERIQLLNTGLDVQTATPADFASRQANLVVSFTEMMRKAGYSPE